MNGKKEGFDYTFSMCRANLRVVGLWPNMENSKYEDMISFLLFTISIFTISTFVTLAQTSQLLVIWGDLNMIINNLSTANLPIAVVLLKMFLLRNYRKELATLLSSVIEDCNAFKTEKEMTNMFRNMKVSRRISYICIILGIGSVNGQLAIRISQELDILSGQTEKRQPMLSSHFPYDYKPSPIYEITWLLQYVGAILATLAYSGIYCLFVGLVLHLRGQVANLRLKFESLEVDAEKSKSEFRVKFGLIVERHERLNRFARRIENIFNGIFLADIVCSTVQICLQFFLLVTLISDNNKEAAVPILQILFMMIYIMHVGTHMFLCCFVSDKLRDESLSICKSAYNFEWYKIPPKDSKLLLVVMQRSEKPLVVTAGKFCTFSLRLFAQIIKTSGGYLSMLLAVKDRI